MFVGMYRKARENEMEASRRLNEMIANYGDVIPRRDYEELHKQHEVHYTFQLSSTIFAYANDIWCSCSFLSSCFYFILSKINLYIPISFMLLCSGTE